ncbi:MAG: ABC transporter ATP-binding protein [Candidatus Omnitrophica bacterium]|nr:ABC transporter ATP-binding protein [Candidatus Omnitrophota bacterium]
MSTALLNVNDMNAGYGKETIIKNISFAVQQGDFLGIIGPNGSGKTTLLKVLTRVIPHYQGEITFENTLLRQIPLRAFARKVACVAQESTSYFSFSAEEIALLGRSPHLGRWQQEGKTDFAIAEESLRATDTLLFKDKDMNTLSAGERQRVIIAKALAQEPKLLFLDEPTSHLDIGHQIQILNLLQKLNREKNLTIVIVLHDLNLASEYCNRIILMDQGRIFKEGNADEVLTYKNIEEVYKTLVLVHKNPLSNRPYIILVSGKDR